MASLRSIRSARRRRSNDTRWISDGRDSIETTRDGAAYPQRRMRRTDKAIRVMEILDGLYPEPPIPLDHRDPFTLLVAVVLSAQTTDKKVNQVTPALFAAAPTPERMAALGREAILPLIREVGLAPQKAKALEGLSRLLLERHGAAVPASFEALEALPGVGHKTASVVMAQAFGEPAFPVDTHIHRCAARWGLSDGRSVERTERDLKKVFPRERWNALHLQIIFFGREHCPALRHDLDLCPICAWAASKRRKRDEARGGRPGRAEA
jgi:endonuclease-3